MSKQKTPYFVIDKIELDNGLKKLNASILNSWPNYIIGYSYKTNALPWVVEYFRNNGCFAEVVSDDEYNLALSIGVEKNKIIYNGVAKSKESFLDAVRSHAIVNIDSENEIAWLDDLSPCGESRKQYSVGIRVNFDLEKYCPGQTQCGEEGERFGFCYENGELLKAIERIKAKGVVLSGLHLHKSSKTRMPDIYRAIATIAVDICRKYKLEISYIDIGGGFFGGLDSKPQFNEYFDLIADILSQHFDFHKTTLIVEPGMALIGSPVDYVSTVVDVKPTNRNTFVVTDGSRIHIDPLMSKNWYFVEYLRNEEKRKLIERQVVVGFTCMEHDRLFIADDSEELLPGDSIIYHKVGAYTMCLSPLFIKWFPDVYLREGDRLEIIRDKWTTEKLIPRRIKL